VSVYMLEVDEDSRLGREMLSAGNREQGTGSRLKYGAGEAPGEDETAEWYEAACEWLEGAGVKQYEISNFAREGSASRHNVKYWRREPYAGFGLDAHSMLRAGLSPAQQAVRWANPCDLEEYLEIGSREQETGISKQLPVIQLPDRALGREQLQPEWIGLEKAFEETLFLGLRMNEGVNLAHLLANFSRSLVDSAMEAMREMAQAGMLRFDGECVTLTVRGRMASNEVFGRLLISD
jgi:oxygen-independent coproporphyrinogen-3 oxidase